MIKTLKELLESRDGLAALLKVRLADQSRVFALARLLKRIGDELATFDECRAGLFRRYGIEADGKLTVPSENVAYFSQDMESLLDSLVDLPEVSPVTLDELPAGALSAVEMIQLQTLGVLAE